MILTTPAPQVLDGVRVLDLGSFITAPYAALLLAEMGADVVKVEAPGGDILRFLAAGSRSPGNTGSGISTKSPPTKVGPS